MIKTITGLNTPRVIMPTLSALNFPRKIGATCRAVLRKDQVQIGESVTVEPLNVYGEDAYQSFRARVVDCKKAHQQGYAVFTLEREL